MDTLYRRVEAMAVDLPDAISAQQLAEARNFLQRADPQVLRRKLQQRTTKIPWLVAEPIHTLAGAYPVTALPEDWSVVAADGSTIPPDRHSPVRYCVLNIGHALLTYGAAPDALLWAQGHFFYEESELYFDHLEKRIPIEGARLGIRMAMDEIDGLLAAARCAAPPLVALRDGSLIFWDLQNEDVSIRDEYLGQLLEALDAFRDAQIPVASYISYPGSHDVINSLRLMLCDRESADCARCPQETGEQVLCRFMGGLWDRDLYRGLLRPGDRSDIFASQSAILERYRAHRIQFFYLDVEGEIARIEAPQWVLDDPSMLELVHSTVVDQCRRSGQYPPYPPVLIEAHEQAVISTADRQAVGELVEQALADKGRFYLRSAKDRSKRSRGV
jgi:hypothetical protein